MTKGKRQKKKNSPLSEFRQDLVTRDWVVIATGRAKRPKSFIKDRANNKRFKETLKDDPFKNPQASGNAEPLLVYPGPTKDDWSLQVIPNKFPAVKAETPIHKRKVGPYNVMGGTGYHEVVITRDPEKHIAILDLDKVEEVIRAYRARFEVLRSKEEIRYISIFHNHGPEAGASLAHPHSQIIAIPVMSADVGRSLKGSKRFNDEYGQCVHCKMIDWERKDKQRIIFENDDFIAFCPFISRLAFEVRIFPKNHSAYFETISAKSQRSFAEILQRSLYALYGTLDDPDYNFFIHAAPVKDGPYDFYHWHLEILPKTAIFAGFELGTGIEISTLEPEKAAEFLRDNI